MHPVSCTDIHHDITNLWNHEKVENTKIYHLDPVKFASAPGLTWEAASKNALEEEYVTQFINMQKPKTNIMKDYYKNKESPYLQYWEVINLYGWAMPQKLHVNKFERIKNTSQFNQDIIKNYSKENYEECFLEHSEKLLEFHNDLTISPEKIKI